MPGPWHEPTIGDAARELAALLCVSSDVSSRHVARAFLEPELRDDPVPAARGTQQQAVSRVRRRPAGATAGSASPPPQEETVTPRRIIRSGGANVICGGGQPSTAKKGSRRAPGSPHSSASPRSSAPSSPRSPRSPRRVGSTVHGNAHAANRNGDNAAAQARSTQPADAGVDLASTLATTAGSLGANVYVSSSSMDGGADSQRTSGVLTLSAATAEAVAAAIIAKQHDDAVAADAMTKRAVTATPQASGKTPSEPVMPPVSAPRCATATVAVQTDDVVFAPVPAPRVSSANQQGGVADASADDASLPDDVDALRAMVLQQRLRIADLEAQIQAFDDEMAEGAERLQQHLAELDV